MKKTILFKTMLLLCALIVGSSSAWADTEVLTLDCATPAPSGTTSTALTTTDIAAFLNSAAGLSSAEKKITCSAKSGDVYKGKGSGGAGIPQECLKIGKASGPGSFTFTIPDNYDNIDAVEITCYGWKTSSSIKVNNGTAQTFTTAAVETTKTFELSSSSRTISIDVTSSAVCVTEIVLKKKTSDSPLTSIEVTGTPTVFCLGDAWNTDGITVTATYEDNSATTVTGEFSGYDKATAGEQTITVSYTEGEVTKTDTYTITVMDYTALVLDGNYATEFWTGDAFSHTGLTATAQFESGLERSADENELVFSTPDMSTAGTKTITVSYTIEGVTKSANYNITVTDKPLYTITWMVNGVKHSSRKVTMDELIGEFPTPSTIGGKTFAGWVTTATVAQDYSGNFVNTETATATGNITYYAVFAEAKPGTIVDVLNRALTGITGTQYDSWSGKKSNSNAVYAGQSAGGNSAIQLRSNNNNSGVVTTASGGNAKKVVVVWDSETTSGRTLDVYGKNSAYSAPTDLYNSSNQGTKLGSIKCGDGESTELTISGDYEYIGMRSNSGAMYLDEISITWDATTYTYTTTPAAVGTTVTVGETGYATFVYPYAVAIPANVKAYVVKEANSTSAKITAVENNIPANTPVVLKAPANDYTFNVADDNVDAINDNLLAVSTAETGNGVYVLYNGASGVGFYLWSGGSLGAGRVYLPAIANAREFIGLDSETTGISTVNSEAKSLFNGEFFNMAGQRVAKPAKGLYIVNGKKVVIK